MDTKEMNMTIYKLIYERRNAYARIVVERELELAAQRAYQQAEKLIEEQDTYGLGNKFRGEDPIPKIEEKLKKHKMELEDWDKILEHVVRTFV